MSRSSLDTLRGRRVLLVASTGGHLNELLRLEPLLGVAEDSAWLTFDTPQSRSVLKGRRVHHVPYVRPRDLAGVIRGALGVAPQVGRYDAAVSTGAAVALSALPLFAAAGKPSVYLESVSRVEGPSVSGRLLERFPRIGLYSQHAGWAQDPWQVGPSVLSTYRVAPTPPRLPLRLFVTLGTIAPYRFDRLVDAVLAYQGRHPEVEVVWQVGATGRTDLRGRVVTEMSEADFAGACRWADAVIAHGGVGVAMNVLDAGKPLLVLARRQRWDEHVDDHQAQIVAHLIAQGLASDAADALADDRLMAQAVATTTEPRESHT